MQKVQKSNEPAKLIALLYFPRIQSVFISRKYS